ncbi:MAG: VTT domain-containing protein [Acidobacteriota bacterium]|nr:VTT domain-containing protein [Blastocatellia bacterium]MDW8411549.1 VTT domain-containing protein [Acidobacteriota bacterium]
MDSLIELFKTVMDVRALIVWGGYIGLIAIVFAETGLMAGFFLPGDSLLVTAGLFAAKGDLDIWVLNVTLIIAAIVGDAVGYYIGHKAGQALYSRPNSRFFKREHLLRAKRFYDKHGGKTIILARFIPIIRTFAPTVAGAAEMTYRKFAIYNVVGGIAWVTSMTLLGYFLGSAIPNIDKHIHLVIAVVVFLSILPGIIEYFKERRRAATDAEQPLH